MNERHRPIFGIKSSILRQGSSPNSEMFPMERGYGNEDVRARKFKTRQEYAFPPVQRGCIIADHNEIPLKQLCRIVAKFLLRG